MTAAAGAPAIAAEAFAIDAAVFRDAMRRTAAGVAVITTAGPAGRAGLTVSSFSSLSLAPPSVMFTVNRASRTAAALEANASFVANILAAEQEHVAKVFAGMVPELRDDKFALGGWSMLASGSPALDAALCNVDCRVAMISGYGTHMIVVGEVVAVRNGGAHPLVFSDHGFHRLPPRPARGPDAAG